MVDSLKEYLAILDDADITPPTTAEERVLTQRWINGTPEEKEAAGKELIERNMPLVISRAKPYFGMFPDERENIIQIGVLGLNKALKKYDPSKETKFSTYATWWIRQQIGRYLVKNRLIKQPQNVIWNGIVFSRKVTQFSAKNGRKPTDEELIELLEISEGSLGYAKNCIKELKKVQLSLQKQIGSDSTMQDFEEDPSSPDPRRTTQLSDARNLVTRELSKLSPREQYVMIYRHGLLGKEELTLEETGKLMGLTRERVRQIENKAKKKFGKKERAERAPRQRDRERSLELLLSHEAYGADLEVAKKELEEKGIRAKRSDILRCWVSAHLPVRGERYKELEKILYLYEKYDRDPNGIEATLAKHKHPLSKKEILQNLKKMGLRPSQDKFGYKEKRTIVGYYGRTGGNTVEAARLLTEEGWEIVPKTIARIWKSKGKMPKGKAREGRGKEKFSDEQKERVIEYYEIVDKNARKAAEELRKEGIDISDSTVKIIWKKGGTGYPGAFKHTKSEQAKIRQAYRKSKGRVLIARRNLEDEGIDASREVIRGVWRKGGYNPGLANWCARVKGTLIRSLYAKTGRMANRTVSELKKHNISINRDTLTNALKQLGVSIRGQRGKYKGKEELIFNAYEETGGYASEAERRLQAKGIEITKSTVGKHWIRKGLKPQGKPQKGVKYSEKEQGKVVRYYLETDKNTKETCERLNREGMKISTPTVRKICRLHRVRN